MRQSTSLLSLQAAAGWRSRLTELSDVRLLASIGDYGLFTHALVQVACAIFRKGSTADENQELTALVTSNDSHATGDALRWLRKIGGRLPSIAITEESWSIFPLQTEALRTRPTWRFLSPGSYAAVQRLEEALLPSIGNLFDVRQGIQTGYDKALLLTETDWRTLPKRERGFFRPATVSDSIQNATIVKRYYVFFPHQQNGPLFANETELRVAVPEYYKRHLMPHKERLAARKAILDANRSDWWGLMRARSWSFDSTPRIISKYFAAEGGFVGDYEARYLPVMGFAWLPKKPLLDAPTDAFDTTQMLAAYVGLFNSRPFVKLLSAYSPHVSGGQFRLDARYVDIIPVPNLADLSIDPVRGQLVMQLANLGLAINLGDPQWRARAEGVVSEIYGHEVIEGL